MKRAIFTNKAPAAIGPYSQAIRVGNFIFVAAQIANDPKTAELITGGIEKQTKQVLENIKAVLKEAGSSMDDVVKTTCFLADIKDFPMFNQVYARYFKTPYPARATIEAAALPKGAKVEIEVIAFIDNDK